jgi:hypothetical protein
MAHKDKEELKKKLDLQSKENLSVIRKEEDLNKKVDDL